MECNKDILLAAHVCDNLPPWSRNAFSPGHSTIHGYNLLLESTQIWRQSASSAPGYKEQRHIECMLRQRSLQTISRGDNFAPPSTLQTFEKYEEMCEQWDPGIILEMVFRLVVANVDMTRRLHLGSEFQIFEATVSAVYGGLAGCRKGAPLLIHIDSHVELGCLDFMQIYLAKIWTCGQRGMLFADHEKLSVVHETARAQLAPGDLLFVPFIPLGYCTIICTTRKTMEIVAKYYSSTQSDSPLDNCVHWDQGVMNILLKYAMSSIDNLSATRMCVCTSCLRCYVMRLYAHLIYAQWWQPSQLLDQVAGIPFYQGCVLDKVPHSRSAIISERSDTQGYYFSLEFIPPWQPNDFSPGPSTLVKLEEQHLARGDLQVKNSLQV